MRKVVATTVQWVTLAAIVIATLHPTITNAQILPEYYLNNAPHYNESDSLTCAPGGAQVGGGGAAANITQGGWTKVGVSVFGNWGDDNGQGALGRHAGHTMFAELSTPGVSGLDFARLANVLNAPENERGWPGGSRGYKPGSKFAINYGGEPNEDGTMTGGNTIVMEKRDVGGKSGRDDGAPRSVDLWWETARLIGIEGLFLGEMWIQKVPDETPVTPIGGGPAAAPPAAAGTGGGGAAAGLANCSGVAAGFGGGADAFILDGMAFPIAEPKAAITQGGWCYNQVNNCHHHYNAADIMMPEGSRVVVAKGGEVITARPNASGASGNRATVTIRDTEGYIWFYTHGRPNSLTVQQGQTVQTGQPLMVVGNRAAADNTPPHLHIDALPPGSANSRPGCASASCMQYPFINVQAPLKQLYDAMP